MAHPSSTTDVAFTAFVGRPVAEVSSALRSNAAALIAGGGPQSPDHVVVNLDVPLGNEGSVRRPALVTIGLPAWEGETFKLPVAIASLERERWFPTFEGSLELDEVDLCDTRVRLVGSYDLPFGILGRATGHAGDKLARASLYSLFVSVVAAVQRELAVGAPAWRPAAAAEVVRRHDDHPLGS